MANNNGIGLLGPTLTGYNNNPAFIRVNKSGTTTPPGASVCGPLSLLDIRPGGTGSFSDADWANPTIIDQVTFLWAESGGFAGGISPNHMPTEYTATLDGSNNITGISIYASQPYIQLAATSCLTYGTINTDYMMAIDAGIDITDHAAIKATVKSEVILMSVVSSVMP